MNIQGHEISGRLPMFTKENRQKNRDGLKTMTRRLMKKQPADDVTSFGCLSPTGEWQGLTGDPKDCDSWGVSGDWIKCPYGQPGQYRVMPEPLMLFSDSHADWTFYQDDGEEGNPVIDAIANVPMIWRWKNNVLSSLFMPMEAGRSVFLIEDIKVERLGEISEEDAKAEGAFESHVFSFNNLVPGVRHQQVGTCREMFIDLWDSIHGPGSWERDKEKWVWVIKYMNVALDKRAHG